MIYIRASHRSVRAAYVRFGYVTRVYVHGSSVCPFFRPSSTILLLLPSPVRSSDRAFAATTCTRSYRHFRHPRDSTKAQLDGSNWTANERIVIRTNNPSFPLPLPHPISPFIAKILDTTMRCVTPFFENSVDVSALPLGT